MKNNAYCGQILDMASQKTIEFLHEKCHAACIINHIIVLQQQQQHLSFFFFWHFVECGELMILGTSEFIVLLWSVKWSELIPLEVIHLFHTCCGMVWILSSPFFPPLNFPYSPTFVKVNLCFICLKDFASDFYPLIMTVTSVCHPFYSAGATASKTVVSYLDQCFMDVIFNNLQNSSTTLVFLKWKCSGTSSVLKNWTYSLAKNQTFAMKMCQMVWD